MFFYIFCFYYSIFLKFQTLVAAVIALVGVYFASKHALIQINRNKQNEILHDLWKNLKVELPELIEKVNNGKNESNFVLMQIDHSTPEDYLKLYSDIEVHESTLFKTGGAIGKKWSKFKSLLFLSKSAVPQTIEQITELDEQFSQLSFSFLDMLFDHSDKSFGEIPKNEIEKIDQQLSNIKNELEELAKKFEEETIGRIINKSEVGNDSNN